MSQYSLVLVSHQSDVGGDLIFPFEPASPSGSSSFCSPGWYALVLGGIGNTDFGCASWGLLPSYWPFEERLILDFLHNLMYWISEHSVNCLGAGRSGLLCIVSPWSVVVFKSVRPEVLHLLRDNLRFILTQLLVIFNSFILVDSVHKLA